MESVGPRKIRECCRHAAECSEKARHARDPEGRTFWKEREEFWLNLAQSYEVSPQTASPPDVPRARRLGGARPAAGRGRPAGLPASRGTSRAALIRFCARELDDARPLLGLLGNVPAEVGGTSPEHRAAEILKARRDPGICQHLV